MFTVSDTDTFAYAPVTSSPNANAIGDSAFDVASACVLSVDELLVDEIVAVRPRAMPTERI